MNHVCTRVKSEEFCLFISLISLISLIFPFPIPNSRLSPTIPRSLVAQEEYVMVLFDEHQ
jgi:hypothetical protein